ncbi:Uncharacterised protein [uncultured archaeon]|nr:Uncharacterised protein [uncultured archaeon]
MDSAKTVRLVGIIVAVVMALSMVSFAFIYVDRSGTNTGTGNDLPQATDKPFDYTLSFETTALKDLGSMKIALMTSSTDKTIIDSAVLKIDGVSKVTSQFKKSNLDANDWVYLADIVLKKNTDASGVAVKIIDLNYFDSTQGFDARKQITVSAPAWVILKNTDLNIDRNFSFTTTTLPTLAMIGTAAGDKLQVDGTITVQGAAINALSLYETINLTKNPIKDLNIPIDANALADTNAPIDANSA